MQFAQRRLDDGFAGVDPAARQRPLPTMGAQPGRAPGQQEGSLPGGIGFGDRDGDAFVGRRTLPVALGDKQARFLIAALCMIVGFTALTAVIRYHSTLPLAMLLPASLVVGFLTVSPVLWRRHLPLRLPYQCFMSSQYLVNIAMLVQLGMA